ncbi:MAG: HEPN domain-containing protein [Bacteroidales bacterium]|nr:HEPN domain-containing protein [Bacteroidales bacterium]
MKELNKDNLIHLIHYRLSRSEEVLDDAKSMIDKGSQISAVNRLYYACFYAALGLLLTDGHSPKSHDGVITLLGQRYILTGIIPKELGKHYSLLYKERISGDYDEFAEYSPEILERFYQNSQAFIKAIKDITLFRLGERPKGN